MNNIHANIAKNVITHLCLAAGPSWKEKGKKNKIGNTLKMKTAFTVEAVNLDTWSL